MADGEYQILYQFERSIYLRRSGSRHGLDGAQNHRRHLRRMGASRWRGVLGQRSVEGGSFGRVFLPLGCQEHCCGATGGSRGSAFGVHHRRNASHPLRFNDVRHGTLRFGAFKQSRYGGIRRSCGGDHRTNGFAASDLSSIDAVRAFHEAEFALGADQSR